MWRDLKVRYKQTAFGALWALIQPLALMLVFSLVSGASRASRRRACRTPCSRWWLLSRGPCFLRASSARQTASSTRRTSSRRSTSRASCCRSRRRLVYGRLRVGLVVLLVVMLLCGICRLNRGVLGPAADPAGARRCIGVRHLAVCDQRALPGCPVRGAVPGPGVAVRVPGRLLGRRSFPNKWRGMYMLNPMAGVIEGFRWALLGGGPAPVVAGRRLDRRYHRAARDRARVLPAG